MNTAGHEEVFPWTLDQYQRYAVLRSFLGTYYPGSVLSVLDVGGLSPGRDGASYWLPLKEIQEEKTRVLDRPFCGVEGYIQGDGLDLPFKDGAFDVTAALDVVEHIDGGQRPRFIRELCRTARRAVIISAPFRDASIEAAEDALQEQTRTLCGQAHRQLQEHRAKGLPDISEITGSIRGIVPSGLDFSYGSLGNWCALQAIKNGFSGRRSSGRIHSLLDRWMASVLPASGSDFRPPLARHFWLFSKDLDQGDLEKGREDLMAKLAEGPGTGPVFSDCAGLAGEISGFFRGDRISAVVVAQTGRNLKECLNHLLTQDSPVDLAATVWDLGRAPEVGAVLRDHFPAVKRYEAPAGARADNALLGFMGGHSENLFLLLAEDVLLPGSAVKELYARWKNGPAAALLSPRIVKKSRAYGVWSGAGYSPIRAVAGRLSNPFWRLKSRAPAWLFSECLFFERSVLGAKKLGGRPLKKRNLFFWEKAGPEGRWTYVPEVVVYKK